MGDDGAMGLSEMHDAGSLTLAQDEDSCVVYGMPRKAVECGAVDEIKNLEGIVKRLIELRWNSMQFQHNLVWEWNFAKISFLLN